MNIDRRSLLLGTAAVAATPTVSPTQVSMVSGAPSTPSRQPPKGVTNKQLKMWYVRHVGHVPMDWKSRPKV